MEKNNICRTAIGISIQASKLLGRPHEFLRYTTLNERFQINDTAHQDITTPPNIGYIAIGRGAHTFFLDNANTPVPDVIEHETTDTACFQPVPFVLREINNDLPQERRNQYALRRKEQHGGKEYWAYYLKRLTSENLAPEIIHDNTKDGVTTSKRFVYTNDNLHPTPLQLPTDGVVVSSADMIRVSTRVLLSFDALDVTEYLAVSRILFGSEKSSLISEIAICSGIDREVQVEGGSGSTVTVKEAIGVQVCTFISTFINISQHNNGFHQEYEVGGGEPLLTKGEGINTRYSPEVRPSIEASHLAGTRYDATNPRNGQGSSTTASITAGLGG